jgi:hypothetical protein
VTKSQWTFKRQRIEGVTDITVYRSPVDHVLVPYDRVDTLQEASETCPDHEQARARIPSYVVILRKNTPIR